MNKSELIEQIAKETGETKAATERFYAAFQKTVIEQVAKGESVKLTGFFVAEPVDRAARMGKNPRTGEDMQIAASKSVKMKAGKHFRDTLNGK